MDNTSGVGVLDKAALVLTALEAGPATLAALVQQTGLARPTAHRLAVALEHHRLVARDLQGRFMLGPRLGELAAAAGEDRLLAAAGPVLARLRDITGESAQLFRRQGDVRVCVAAVERPTGLRDSVPVGSQLTMNAGSAAQILLAWEDPERMHRGLQHSTFSAAALAERTQAGLGAERRRARAGRRLGVGGGPRRRPARSSPRSRSPARSSGSAGSPGRMHAPAVMAAAERLSQSLRRSPSEPSVSDYLHGHARVRAQRAPRGARPTTAARTCSRTCRGDESLLDVGCGPGTITVGLARHLPRGHVLGIDPARRRRRRGDGTWPSRSLCPTSA